MTTRKWFTIGLATILVAACQAGPPANQQTFSTPEAAAEALILAAEQHDVAALQEILGPDGIDLVVTEDEVQDRNTMTAFAAQAREKMQVVRDPDMGHAIVTVGAEDWPLAIPIAGKGDTWWFDTADGREELLARRIGTNELDAIQVSQGYVEAQHEYASEKRNGARLNQYAQRIVSTPGTQDGLAWQAADSTWQGPVGEEIARFISEGYSDRYEPFHGYYFKILKGQGPAAPLGELDFLVGGAMIGGFALVAAPADYGVTGIMTFIVSHDGIVYQKDLGPGTVEAFQAMTVYNPDETWTPAAPSQP